MSGWWMSTEVCRGHVEGEGVGRGRFGGMVLVQCGIAEESLEAML